MVGSPGGKKGAGGLGRLRQAMLPFAPPAKKKQAASEAAARPPAAAGPGGAQPGRQHVVLPPPGRFTLSPGCSLLYAPAAIPDRGGALVAALEAEVAWEQRNVTVWGRTTPQRRLVAYQADGGGAPYTYSGLTLQPAPWSPAVARVKAAVEALAGCGFDTCLLNLYRDGADAMAWHADGDALYGPPPVTIASASFGVGRPFQLRPTPGGRADEAGRGGRRRRVVEYSLGGGDVLIMGGATQRDWQHALPPRARVGGVRVNLTFRTTAAFKARQERAGQ